ncbi:tetraacyldisaccharide 4'-kinase [Arcobacter vandammei]|uniref:tetraacyldisaccharide 4'-kinase n=1 Tax=Arcobacter vandammei TaxID=2782243 RepID=UPI0018DFD665|nr:tetraacyldisaccharide 4'-kinase [Arcobacter vandammei]
MKEKLIFWIEDYLFFPNSFQKIISFLFLPFTLIYMFIVLLKRASTSKIDFEIPIISIGNIVVGGSGKTPIAIALAKKYDDACVILRGYGRESKGLFVVSNKGDIKVDVKTSGDEAMVLALSLKNATVIVSENRAKAIEKAKELNCKIIFLDDGFSKYSIKKFDILLRAKKEPTNDFCLPSGAYREPKSFYALCDLELKEGRDFKRVVTIKKVELDKESILPEKTLLLTAISKPKRLLEFVPKNVKLLAFADHHNFTKQELNEILEKYKDYAILTTLKDYVKLKDFNIKDLYLMDLDIKFNDNLDLSSLENYISEFKEFKK